MTGEESSKAESILASIGDSRRHDAEHALTEMTPRERQLFREAAVMGYVRGLQQGQHSADAAVPSDTAIVMFVMESCQTMPDLYPGVAAL